MAPADETVTALPDARPEPDALSMKREPPVTVVAPVYVFLPARVRVPIPDFVRARADVPSEIESPVVRLPIDPNEVVVV
jgi:hypothetical protein